MHIDFVPTLMEGLQTLNLLLLKNRHIAIDVYALKGGTMLYCNVYDEMGNIIKTKNQVFTEKDLESLKNKNITELYYIKEHSDEKDLFKSPFFNTSDISIPRIDNSLIEE